MEKTSGRPVNTDTGRGSGPSKQTKCSRCGKSPNHDIGVCPAKDVICRKCGKKEHFQRACRSKKISSIKEPPKQSDKSFFLGVVWGQKTESMISSTFSELLWQKVGMDLFEWQKLVYLIIVDYYSRFIEIAQLDKTKAEVVIQHCCKNILSKHSIPEEVVMNNGS